MDKLKHVLLLLAATAFAATPAPPSFRLPDDVAPLKHTLELSIDPALSTFEGRAILEVDLRKPAAVIWVNGRDLVPRDASVEFAGRSFPARVEAAAGEFLCVQLDSAVGPGRAIVSIRYQARLDERQVLGAYRRKVEGNWYAYTTFTPIEARRAFPCFDDPHFKTPWEISIRVPAGDKAFSNGREIEDQMQPDGWRLLRFAATEPLPAELVAFGVGPFDTYQGAPAGHGTPIRVVVPKGRAAEGRAAAEAAVEVLPKLEAYTGIPYPFGKLDYLALPESAFGAVENPGLITFLARELLIMPGTETPGRSAALRLLEAHEISHQWFGDLVTQASWADVWLSEGFATWLSEKIMDTEQIPERAHLAAINSRERGMRLDASSRTRPVRLEVHDRARSRDIYNRLVYEKGASVLLMLEGWLGEQPVQEAARAYLKEQRFGNATTADFMAALARASGTDPTAVTRALLDKTGIPRVSVRLKCGGPGSEDKPRVEIRQSGPGPVPVCWRAAGGTRQCTVTDAPAREAPLTNCPAWIYPNAGGSGYYRTAWTAAELDTLPLDDLTPAERLTLAFDLRAQKTDRDAARAMLAKLAADHTPEVAGAAKAALK